MKFNVKKEYDYNKLRSEAKSIIDAGAEKARKQFTTPGSIQSFVYQAKLEEAKRYIDQKGDVDEYPLLNAELEISSKTDLKYIADGVIKAHTHWKSRMAHIEKIRLQRKRMIDQVSDNKAEIDKIVKNTSFL